MNSGKLASKTWIITGATSGMGRAAAALFHAEGANVILSGRDQERGKDLLAGIDPSGERAALLCGDVADEAVNARLVQLAVDRFGSLDGAVLNAGMLGLGSVTEIDVEVWRQTLDVNLNSAFFLARHALPRLKEAGGGGIILNASIAATKCFPNHPAYCASKAALVALGRQMALDYAPDVRVNSICPGPVDTPLIWDSAKAFDDPGGAVRAAGEATLAGRLGQPEDFARLALFLAGPESGWITGAAYTLDGGITVT